MSGNRKNEQSVFITHIGTGLKRTNIVFLLKRWVKEFFNRYPFFKEEHKKIGKSKKYTHEELLAFIVLCYIKEIRTYRKMAKALEDNDEALLYALGHTEISKTVLSDFINNYGYLFTEFLHFTAVKSKEIGLVKNETITLDGTFLEAYANNKKRITRDEIKVLKTTLKKLDFENKDNRLQLNLKKYFNNPEEENKLKQVENILKKLNHYGIKLLKKGIVSKEAKDELLEYLDTILSYHPSNTNFDINLTDPESVFVRDKKGIRGYNYNLQVARDLYKGIIIHSSVVNDSNDKNQLIPMLESCVMVLGEKPKFFLCDGGYYKYEALYYCYIHNVSLIIPDGAESRRKNNKNKTKKYAKERFKYDRWTDTYTCPQGVKLPLNRITGNKTIKTKVYSTTECLNCKYHDKCCKTKVRELRDKVDPLTEYFKDIYFSVLGQKLYKKRANLSEGIFAHVKENRNYVGFKRRGLEKCQILLDIESIASNLEIINRESNSKNRKNGSKKYEQTRLFRKW